MKLDYNLIKSILEKIEKDANGYDTVWIQANKLSDSFTQEQIDYHLQILEDDALIDVQAQGGTLGTIAISRLTAEGHRVLEAMQNDTLWNKIKDKVDMLGKQGLKEIPSLFIKLALTNLS